MNAPEPAPFDLEELRAQVAKLDGSTWRVEKTLRSTPYGETQLVYRNGSEAGPFIRKFIPSDARQGSAYETIFRAQAAGTRFKHVPFIYDCTRSGSGIAVVMELVPGKTLREYVANVGPGNRAASFAARALCDALVEIHTALDVPIIHRDIKPGNVMVSPAGITFIDLDITREWKAGAERDTQHFGTPGYAPPEQFGFEQTGVAADIFAAGMTLAFCCTGEDPTTALRESGFDDPRIPAWIRPILVKATQFDPAARFQSAAEMSEAVTRAMTGAPPKPAAPPQAAAPADAGHLEATENPTPSGQADSPFKKTMKYVWNAIVVALTVYFVVLYIVSFLKVAQTASPEQVWGAFTSNPVLWIVAVIESVVALLIIPLVGYLALFKMRLRKIRPFSKYTWKQELPAGVGFITFVVISMMLINQFMK